MVTIKPSRSSDFLSHCIITKCTSGVNECSNCSYRSLDIQWISSEIVWKWKGRRGTRGGIWEWRGYKIRQNNKSATYHAYFGRALWTAIARPTYTNIISYIFNQLETWIYIVIRPKKTTSNSTMVFETKWLGYDQLL